MNRRPASRPQLTAFVALHLALAGSTALAATLVRRGEYRSGAPFGAGGAEIVTHRAWTDLSGPHLRAYIVNGANNAMDLVDLDDPAAPVRFRRVDLTAAVGTVIDGPTSVAFDPNGRGVAIAIGAAPRTDPGWVVFFDPDGNKIASVVVGSLPDMVTFTPDGRRLLVANEGEPSDDYAVDPEGSVAIIDTDLPFPAPTARFARFVAVPETGSVRHFGPNALDPARDFEPEYISVEPAGQLAYVGLQENGAIAVLDLATERFVAVHGLGWKDHSLPGNGLDPSDRDSGIAIATYPLLGMYQPDSIAAFVSGGRTYLATANEGDQREYGGFDETSRVKNLVLESPLDPALTADDRLGRLVVTTTLGDQDRNGSYEALYAFGTRSFSVLDADSGMTMVHDSGDQIEQTIAALQPTQFNCNNDSNASFDGRSDNKGPEPEGLTVGAVCGGDRLFLGLERQSGVMVYDLADPTRPLLESYATTRDFSVAADDPTAGGIGPEGLHFVPATDNPAGEALLLTANEMSGTLDVWAIACSPTGLPPRDAGNTLMMIKPTPTSMLVMWSDAPSGTGYDRAATYEIHQATRGCGPFAVAPPPVTRVPGLNQTTLARTATPSLELFSIVSRNPAGASIPLPPDGSLCP